MDNIIGKTILGYKVIEKIGSGGYGDVYKVERSNIVGDVTRALKVITLPKESQYVEVLNSMGGDREKVDEYFKEELNKVVNEIRVFSMISEQDNHNIVLYHENDVEQISSSQYNIYILMEMLTPLDKWMQQNNLTVGQALDIGIAMAKALSICHENEIIHRDIKMNNIFVSKKGNFKLGDFGVSKRLDTMTRAHTVKGTPHYIAPEIYRDGKKYNNQVDIYSLGILMYYLFNKFRYPFYPEYPGKYTSVDEDKAFYKRMNYEEPSQPCFAPENVANAILKSLKPPEQRYEKVDDFLHDLEKAKSELSKEQLQCHIGFEPQEKNDGISTKEKKLVMQLHTNNVESISLMEDSIKTTGGMSPIKKKKKRFLYVLGTIILMAVAVSGYALWGGKKTTETMNEQIDSKNATFGYEQESTIDITRNTVNNESRYQEDKVSIGYYVGKKINVVKADLERRGIKVYVDKTYHNKIKSGIIIAQSIKKNTMLQKGDAITLQVSKGKKKETTKKVIETTSVYIPKENPSPPQTATRKSSSNNQQINKSKPKSVPQEDKEDNINFGDIIE